MIRIKKRSGPPILTKPQNRGRRETEQLKAAYNAGEREFKFHSRIYGSKSVKKALIKAQHGKCCFCESKVVHVAYGDVEHFRPKGGWVQQEGEPLVQPGYYWLAYDWNNLFFACQICNQRHKKNHFPLATARTRARSHHDDLSREDPLFADPQAEDPQEFIGFREEVAFAIDGNPRGKAMIEYFGLDRPEIVERRDEHLARIRLLKETYLLFRQREQQGRLDEESRNSMLTILELFQSIAQPDAEYSSMMTAFLSDVLSDASMDV